MTWRLSPMRRRMLVAVLVLVAFVAGALWRGGGDDGHRHDTGDAGQPDAPAASTQMYYCSMHPQVRSPDPDDKCPICFMDLIPLPAEDEEEDAGDVPRLRVGERAAALMDIRTWPVERRAVEIGIDLFGKVGFDESRLYDIVARTDAYVERLTVNTPWQRVAKGDVLAEFYSPAVVTAFHELLVAADRPAVGEAGDADSNLMLEAARERLLRRHVSAAQIDAVIASGDVPRTFRVESPAAGVALPMGVREGEWLREGGRLTRIADLSRVWVNLEAYERDLALLAAGQPVRFQVAAYPGETFEGEIVFIDPVVHERSRTSRLRVEADNPDGRLKPDMLVSATASATLGNGDAALPLIIPATAPLITGRRALVYVRLRDEDRPTFEPRQVTLGPRAGDVYVVSDGLNEGDLVVVNGQFKIDSELQIRGRPSMMSPEGGKPPVHDHGQGGHAASVAPAADQANGGQDRHAADEPRLQTECPVMGGLINTDFYADVKGYRIYVCCPGCDQTILDDPDTYLNKMKAEGITPYRLQTHCPIMGGEINREFYHDHDGHRIYVCCPGCLDEVKERADAIIAKQFEQGVVFERAE